MPSCMIVNGIGGSSESCLHSRYPKLAHSQAIVSVSRHMLLTKSQHIDMNYA